MQVAAHRWDTSTAGGFHTPAASNLSFVSSHGKAGTVSATSTSCLVYLSLPEVQGAPLRVFQGCCSPPSSAWLPFALLLVGEPDPTSTYTCELTRLARDMH